ncbi:L(+)-tartrate dehydratase alpha subunit [Rhodoblastus acidophilus]|uniref:L(+)-tartrate dehydratase alpha subunit n=1 Tax=Rhodoblastus acidophilus TaxID=1074 RepID=A0A212S8Z4_RHOAC|nr:fumarate hydratase [Rhodoblastus acidophilus]PPQ36263.1 fumarate hydratase [Rhodoblastus acidophilus]RAI20415.1 fumarate hydratase [Rhodoblastus acidophilus]SNB81894.1 L(+)-tartrate dehydratase alpha subunit [Rhodoblastus acidophilus]
MILLDTLDATAGELMRRAAIDIPPDMREGVRRLAEAETEDLPRFVLNAMLENWEVAEQDRRAMCADTGLPRWYVKAGNDARVEGGFIGLERILRTATARETAAIPLRPNRVHPLSRRDLNNNCGMGAPEIDYSFEPDADWIDLIAVHKGGLFGTDWRMLFPGDGIDGIKRFFLDCLLQFGKRGLACQPAIFGIGLGGSKDACMVLGKQAACLRPAGSRHPDPQIAALEDDLQALAEKSGMGAMGFVGRSMSVDVHVEAAYTHTGGMPVSIHAFCLSSRRAVARLHADGQVDFRDDPQWFTPYSRREGL